MYDSLTITNTLSPQCLYRFDYDFKLNLIEIPKKLAHQNVEILKC